VKYNEGVEIKIITNLATAKECLLPLLNELKYMGGIGSSRSIKIEDWDGNDNFIIDGDGVHGIYKIFFNNKEHKGEKVKKSYNKRGVQDGTGPYKDSAIGNKGPSSGRMLGKCPKRENYETEEEYEEAMKKWRKEKSIKKSKASTIEHKTPPKEYSEEGAKKRSQYADPKRFKYPVHTAENAAAALRYFSKPKNRSGYSSEEVKSIGKRIISACKKYSISVSENTYKNFGLKPPKMKRSLSLRKALELRIRR